MFSTIKTFFTGPTPQPSIKEKTMFTSNTTASIRQMKNGRFRLLENGNEVVATYARRRDALRGASRRGLTVA